MHILFALAGFGVLVAAVPRPQDDLPSIPISITETIPTATDPVIESTSLNIPITTLTTIVPTSLPGFNLTSSTSKRRPPPHNEPIPIYSCSCAPVSGLQRPCWAYDAYHTCIFEENHSYGCHIGNFVCPSPTRKCGELFTSVPLTGRHPCDLGGPFRPEPTEAPITTTAV
ncbi:hypothetical protein B0J11DRAFT_94352 [Dendryphion nanum]|uniref:Uncharacterized protein n=1 Tax=Dendryphion nanum TaxID=256645 RepID=A0A9P9DES0_9PLEO|nr:hypothetical protein B0J11DRAFT_94352 [Dendryphion nanum]